MFSVVSLAKRKMVEIKLRRTHESVVLNQGKKYVFDNWQLHLKEKEVENYSPIDVSVFVFLRILFAKRNMIQGVSEFVVRIDLNKRESCFQILRKSKYFLKPAISMVTSIAVN